MISYIPYTISITETESPIEKIVEIPDITTVLDEYYTSDTEDILYATRYIGDILSEAQIANDGAIPMTTFTDLLEDQLSEHAKGLSKPQLLIHLESRTLLRNIYYSLLPQELELTDMIIFLSQILLLRSWESLETLRDPAFSNAEGKKLRRLYETYKDNLTDPHKYWLKQYWTSRSRYLE